MIEARLIKGDKVFSTDDSGIYISEGGLDYLRQVKFGFMADFEEQKSNSKETINEQERQEIISKIDKVLSRFDKADIQQQVLFEEMEELKEYIGTMSKKTWAQLLKGKLWT